jgi:hypothetical protein
VRHEENLPGDVLSMGAPHRGARQNFT